MFEPSSTLRVFSLAPGQDFPAELVAGLRQRLAGAPPHAMARVTIYLSTQRMKRRIEALFHQGPPSFLPKLRLVTEAGTGVSGDTAPQRSALTRQLELTRFTRALIAAQPDLAAPSAAFDLAGGLANLLDEAQVEGVSFDDILGLDVTDTSGHWQRSLAFLRILHEVEAQSGAQDGAARQRRAVEALVRHWDQSPPMDPVIVAGSTGSRGTTHMLMNAVARLPQGALILPGFDTDLPRTIWSGLTGPDLQEDHPQYRFATLLDGLELRPSDLQPWAEGGTAPDPARNRLVSMALRPAPVTDGWMEDGPTLGPLGPATAGLTLLEAADPRSEAQAIALVLREAAERGRTAALISPDRMLTRRVAAALDRWGIEPDDSAGEPLGQTATGRLLRQLGGLFGQRVTAEDLVVLIKNPRVAIGGKRGPHLRFTRELELALRRDGPAFPTADSLRAWAEARDEEDAAAWGEWLGRCIDGIDQGGDRDVAAYLHDLSDRIETLARGPWPDTSAQLWDGRDGVEARKQLDALAEAAPAGGEVDAVTFNAILRGVLSAEVRDPTTPHPGVMIWGTLEARVQGADRVILAGLNDGVWPEQPDPDPWLNRAMRSAVGLLRPERRIGLSAHDFQQAACAPEVILSRAKRTAEADAVPSRWLNRLTNLLDGLPGQGGPEALAAMRDRGQRWIDLAAGLDRPALEIQPAPRPSPAPPAEARPRKLSVTEVELLLRDPYQIYAKHVLRLRPLDPLRHRPEAALRGSILHKVFEVAVPHFAGLTPAQQRDLLLQAGAERMADMVPWPTARRFWLARLTRVADHFIAEEADRAARAHMIAAEAGGGLTLPGSGMTLTAKADRLDLTDSGALWVYDYKTGAPPTVKQQKEYNKQLHITAFMVEAGGFSQIGPAPVVGAEYIGLGSKPKTVPADFEAVPIETVQESLHRLFMTYLDPQTGFTAQVAREKQGDYSPYDHLSRGGEWDLTMSAPKMLVGDHS